MSELGGLSQCMMDADAGALRQARRLRRKALVGSVCLEAAALVSLLLWPLVAPGVLPASFNSTPAVPIYGKQRPAPQRTEAPHANRDLFPGAVTLRFQPPVIPPSVGSQSVLEPPSVSDWPGEGDTPIGVTGGNENGPAGPAAPLRDSTRNDSPIKVSEGVMQARLVRRVEPVYPRIAQDSHLTGTVRLRALIGTDGSVRQIEVVSGNPMFVPSAVAAIRQWRYEPTRLDGQPVEVETYITVEFVLY